MLSQKMSPQVSAKQSTRCRRSHYQLRIWLESLQAAGDGAWATVREESTDIVVVGDVIDPGSVTQITDETTENEIVGMFETGGMVKIVIELGQWEHNSLQLSSDGLRHIEMDAIITKKQLGLL